MAEGFESSRLLMRNYELSDIDDYFDYISSADVALRLNFEPYKTKEDALERLKKEVQNPYQFAIVLKPEGKVIGSIRVMPPTADEEHKERFKNNFRAMDFGKNPFEIGYLLSPKYWGRGIMTEACVLGVQYAFEKLNASAIAIWAFKANTQSGRVQDKVGFEKIKEIESEKIWIDGVSKTLVLRIMTKECWDEIRAEKIEKYVTKN